MMISFRRVTFLAAVVAAFAGGLLWNGKASVSSGLVSTAEARVGRPLTPVSHAGVARRTTRRAVAAGAAVGAASAYYGSSCVQVVDAYGRVTIRFGAVAPYVSDAGSRQRRPDTASVGHSEPRRKRNG
jgi:hypothetical protein